jgi:hypothetical protein
LLAQNASLTPSDFIRSRTIDAAAKIKKATPERAILITALGQLGKIGSNINQVARELNRRDDGALSEVSAAIIDGALLELKELTTKILKLMEQDYKINLLFGSKFCLGGAH